MQLTVVSDPMQTIVNAFAPCLSALCLTFGFCQLVGTTSIESCMILVLFLLSLAQLFSYCGQISGLCKDCGGLCQEVERVGRSWGRETWWIAIELRSEHDYGGIRLI